MARRLRTQTEYKPVFEDWLFRVLLPLGAHVMLAVSALAARSHVREALFGIGAALLLPFIGIHNAVGQRCVPPLCEETLNRLRVERMGKWRSKRPTLNVQRPTAN